jgi:hypothetical protein
MGRAARGRLGAGPCGAPFPVDFGYGLSLAWWQGRGGQATGAGSAADAPVGRGAVALPGSSMASPLSVGIELQPPGVDRRWVRLWLATVESRACLAPTQDNGAAAAKCFGRFLGYISGR